MQVQFKFDKETVAKILKGAIIAASGSAAIGLLNYVGTLHINNPVLATVVVWFVPTAVNAVKEWLAGEPITI